MPPELNLLLLKFFCTSICTAYVLFYFFIIKPIKNAITESRPTTKEEIDDLFDTIDPINPKKIQGFSNHPDVWN